MNGLHITCELCEAELELEEKDVSSIPTRVFYSVESSAWIAQCPICGNYNHFKKPETN